MQTETLIIGAGLSGLRVATLLHEAGRNFHIIEARNRLGGRVQTIDGFDLGPAWFWAGQPLMEALAYAHGLEVFEQYATGALSYENADGPVIRDMGFSSMQGSYRIAGGIIALINAEASRLPETSISVETPAKSVALSDKGLHVIAGEKEIVADRVVLALPPRLAAKRIAFQPMSQAALALMTRIPTWMAGHAKIVATYETPFWREAGLSGDAMSRRGPMVEIHDASLFKGEGALFGFVGVPTVHRHDQESLKAAAIEQLVRLFGAQAQTPTAVHLADWAFQPETATEADHTEMTVHPAYGMPEVLHGMMDGRLHFAGTEVAANFGGYLEGALVSAESVVADILSEE